MGSTFALSRVVGDGDGWFRLAEDLRRDPRGSGDLSSDLGATPILLRLVKKILYK
ncbi:MAG: hypothetical protein IT349_02195 [Candidatus Eisenbacteria bacterium]|nr:hypothetical protein [Candidatus Eisenbacteria bacterium]MCC7140889.1 hypothetical protein [Candidatus Eisenbacteria bacterium]